MERNFVHIPKEEILKFALNGEPEAQYDIGEQYAEGYGVAKEYDYIQAFEWYQKAALQGYAPAQHKLGILYCNGDGVTQDGNNALYWLHKAAAQNDYDALSDIGWMYYWAEGVEMDVDKAVKYFEKAAIKGDYEILVNLGDLYHYEHSFIKCNFVQALAWYQIAIYNPFMISFYKEQAFNGRKNIIDKMTDDEKYQAFSMAYNWYLNHAKTGEKYIQCCLAAIYEGELIKDTFKYFTFFHVPEENKMYPIYVPVKTGLVFKQSYSEAIKWYKKAAKKNEDYAEYRLGYMYKYGIGTPKNNKKAFMWLTKASQCWFYGDAQFELALMYYEGLGTTKDLVKAFAWFKIAKFREEALSTEKQSTLNQKITELTLALNDEEKIYTDLYIKEWIYKIVPVK